MNTSPERRKEKEALAFAIRMKVEEKIAARNAAREAARKQAGGRVLSSAMVSYYSDLEKSRAKARVAAAKHYRENKHTAKFICHRAARNCINRIVKKVGTRRCPRTRTHEFLGCDYETAAAWISAKFRDGMTWENHGRHWEIDHIRPLASFDLTDETQRMRAMHYTNLQPLLTHENRAKSDRWEEAA